MSYTLEFVETDMLHPVQIADGWRVRQTEHYFVDVLVMMGGNSRIVLTPKSLPEVWDRGWCFRGPLVETVLRCGTFDPEDPSSEPEGWIKQPGTERKACAGYYPRILDGHQRYLADCPNCGDEALYE